jgi:hypothetical protein
MLEHLPSKCKALNLSPSTAERGIRERQRERERNKQEEEEILQLKACPLQDIWILHKSYILV